MRGLALRICLIMTSALMLMVVVGFVIYAMQRREVAIAGMPLPMPEQVAAIVEVVEATPPEKLPVLLRALNSTAIRVEIVAKPPASEGRVAAPMLTRLVRNYLASLGGRPVTAMIDVSRGDPTLKIYRGRFWAGNPVRIVVGLKDGRVLVIEYRSAFLMRFTGIRLALVVLILTLVIGGASLWAVQRQIRPIEKLASAVEEFGNRLDVAPMPESGASDVRRLVGAFNRMQTRIRDLVEGRTRMMAAISHDLGTYLTRLRLRAEFIADEAQRERAIGDIDEMNALMKDTLTLARMENRAEPHGPVDLVALAERQVELAKGEGAEVTLDVPAEPVVVEGREAALGRALANLVSNALKYGKEARVSVATREGRAILKVEDRGPGIPAREREAVLEPFYRRDAARNLDAGGFGLGLAIVADIVRRHEGTIVLGDRPGGGLAVQIELPLASGDQAASV